MTILSKGNLAVELVAKVDDGPCAITNEGATAGSGRRAAMVVTPISSKHHENVSKFLEDDKPLPSGVVVSAKTLNDATKLVGRDSTFKGLLEHCSITNRNDDSISITATDGQREQTINAKRSGKRLDVDTLISAMVRAVDSSEESATFVINRKRLKAVLDAMDKACPDSAGASPVWITIAPDGQVVLRSKNRATNQNAWAMMSSGSAIADPPLGVWEREHSKRVKSIQKKRSGKRRKRVN